MTALDIRRNAVMVDICCNDPDNGLFAGRAEMISIGRNDFIELEARPYLAPRMSELPGAIKLSRRKWPIIGSKYGVGNWCWNGYWMEIPTVVDLLCYLHERKLFSFACGEDRLCNIWHNDKPFDAEDRAFLDRMLGKPLNYT